MEVRQALPEEIPWLKQRLAETGGEQIDLEKARVWVAIEDGRIIGMLPARLCWQLEPLLVFPEVKGRVERSRAGWKLFHAAEDWIADRTVNRTGIHWFFLITRSAAVKAWASRLGLHRQYKGASTFVKHL